MEEDDEGEKLHSMMVAHDAVLSLATKLAVPSSWILGTQFTCITGTKILAGYTGTKIPQKS